MRWTIGMPSYNNMSEVYFTVQSLRIHHDLKDCEIVVIDNFGDDSLHKFVKNSGGNQVRYERFTEITGVSAAKNKIFEIAKGEYVLCIDSHILVRRGALDITPPGDDMIQGPLNYANVRDYCCEWKPVWRSNMWGIWGETLTTDKLPQDPFKIWAMGAGFFACRRDSWLKFNPAFRGFGGETGYIQEKYRKAGRSVWCYPNMIWMHMFWNQGRKVPYTVKLEDRIKNYLLGFEEIGLDTAPIYDHFGKDIVTKIRSRM
jgi:glycosyltransferase involved in cell wall biosynthesis